MPLCCSDRGSVCAFLIMGTCTLKIQQCNAPMSCCYQIRKRNAQHRKRNISVCEFYFEVMHSVDWQSNTCLSIGLFAVCNSVGLHIFRLTRQFSLQNGRVNCPQAEKREEHIKKPHKRDITGWSKTEIEQTLQMMLFRAHGVIAIIFGDYFIFSF